MKLIKLNNKEGFEIEVCSTGMSIKSVQLPWNYSPIIGYNNLEDYKSNHEYHGCIVGRTTNRINKGALKIDNKTYYLDNNHGLHHLHGGKNGLHLVEWEINKDSNSIIGKYFSKSNENGYPGDVLIITTIKLEHNKLIINYKATCETKTPLSLTHHPYFSFGNDFKKIKMEIFADKYIETDNDLIPTGNIIDVDTFNLSLNIDRCYITPTGNNDLLINASIEDYETATKINIWSNYPAFQVYTSTNQLSNVSVEKGNVCICVEPQFMTGFTEFDSFKGFFFDGKNEYNQTIMYEFLNQ